MKPYRSISIRLDPIVYERLEHIASSDDRSLNYIINYAINTYLAQLDSTTLTERDP